jgi:hypothetical protein
MLNNLRNRLPEIAGAGEVAVDRVVKAANTAAQSAKDVTVQLEEWAQEGVDCAKKRPLMWGAASLGFGALMGGLYALWRKAKPNGHAAVKTAPLRSRGKQTLRAAAKSTGAAELVPKKRGKKPGRARSSADA